MSRLFEELQLLFYSEQNQEKAEKMSAYMRNQFEFLGITSPQRKKLAKKIIQESKKNGTIDWNFVQQCWESSYREFQYVAIDYLTSCKKELTLKDIPKIKLLAQSKSWWDTIDGLDRLMGELAYQFPEVKQVLLGWSIDEDFWLRRIAIDHQLLRKTQTDTVLLEQILVNNLNQTEFFINKAIGWSLRDYSKTNPEWVSNFIKKYRNEMSNLSIREASKYLL